MIYRNREEAKKHLTEALRRYKDQNQGGFEELCKSLKVPKASWGEDVAIDALLTNYGKDILDKEIVKSWNDFPGGSTEKNKVKKHLIAACVLYPIAIFRSEQEGIARQLVALPAMREIPAAGPGGALPITAAEIGIGSWVCDTGVKDHPKNLRDLSTRMTVLLWTALESSFSIAGIKDLDERSRVNLLGKHPENAEVLLPGGARVQGTRNHIISRSHIHRLALCGIECSEVQKLLWTHGNLVMVPMEIGQKLEGDRRSEYYNPSERNSLDVTTLLGAAYAAGRRALAGFLLGMCCPKTTRLDLEKTHSQVVAGLFSQEALLPNALGCANSLSTSVYALSPVEFLQHWAIEPRKARVCAARTNLWFPRFFTQCALAIACYDWGALQGFLSKRLPLPPLELPSAPHRTTGAWWEYAWVPAVSRFGQIESDSAPPPTHFPTPFLFFPSGIFRRAVLG